MDIDDVRDMLRELARPSTDAALAKNLKLSPSYLSDVLLGRREPGPKLLAALGLRKVVSYERVPERKRGGSMCTGWHGGSA